MRGVGGRYEVGNASVCLRTPHPTARAAFKPRGLRQGGEGENGGLRFHNSKIMEVMYNTTLPDSL